MNGNGFSGEALLREMPVIIDWLKALQIRNAENSRISRYPKHIDEFFKPGDPSSTEGRERFHRLTRSYLECLYFFVLYRVFKDERSRHFVETLSKVVDGADHPDEQSGGPSRNYLLELFIAARLRLCGYSITFAGQDDVDVIAENGQFLVLVECKKLSGTNLERSIKDAGKQLQKRRSAYSECKKNVIGLMVLDVSISLEEMPRYQFATSAEAANVVRQYMGRFLKANSKKIDELNSRFSPYSHGQLFTATAPLWIGSRDPALMPVTNMQVIMPIELPDQEEKDLTLALDGFAERLQSFLSESAQDQPLASPDPQ